MVARVVWECRGGIRDRVRRNAAKPCDTGNSGFSPVAENGTKAALTTGMTTDRKIFDFLPRRDIMAKIEYPGVAQLVGRDIWDVEVGCSSHLTRTKIPLKLLISEGFSYSLSIAAQEVNLLFLTYLFDKRRLNIVFFSEVQYNIIKSF